ncbi:helix-turn-helix transcriptional regulator [uncultured Bartonella sp.]|uniref:helix-turn-helix domain-containing protein n=1 Tax=uncultured Bartonella sp. TaxID=104108 RepID=UPI0025F18599|nr:helix-turn-helix transcriptional regulator [uncultured Bartonella sp.]
MTKIIDNDVDVKWVKEKMNAAGIRSYAELGRKSGMMQRTLITLVLQGQRNIQQENLIKMAEVLKVSPFDLAEKLGGRTYNFLSALKDMEANEKLEIRGSIDDNFAVHFYDPKDFKTVQTDMKTPVGGYGLVYETENNPIFSGSIAIALEKRESPQNLMSGQNNVVWLADGKVLLRHVISGQLLNRFNIFCANMPPLYDVAIQAFSPLPILATTL